LSTEDKTLPTSGRTYRSGASQEAGVVAPVDKLLQASSAACSSLVQIRNTNFLGIVFSTETIDFKQARYFIPPQDVMPLMDYST
jgi:hypothetical protein